MDRNRRRLTGVLLVACGATAVGGSWPVVRAAWAEQPAAAALPTARVTVRGAEGAEAASGFDVEIASTPEARARGLQHRRSLAADAGMLFLFGAPQPVTMWMKDTFVPLDMLFLAADGRIVAIAENTQPQSLALIRAPEPVSAVLELNAGTARKQGIGVGDHVVFATTGRFSQ